MTTAASLEKTKTSHRVRPRVCIVIVHFDQVEVTSRCLDSLRSLRGDFEIVVVDNGRDIYAREQLRRTGVRVLVSHENGGYVGGNNRGIGYAKAAGAEFVLLLNPDTVLLNPEFLDELTRYFDGRPAVGVVGPRVHLRRMGNVQNTVLQFPWLWRRVSDWFRFRIVGNSNRSGDVPRDAEALNGVCVLFRVSCLDDVGALDDGMFAYIEDIEWSYRAQRRGWKRVYLPVDSVLHLQKATGYERGGTVDYLLKRNTLYFLIRHRKYFQALGYTVATLILALSVSVRSRVGRAVKVEPHPAPRLAFFGRLARVYGWLWLGKFDSAMRPPGEESERGMAR